MQVLVISYIVHLVIEKSQNGRILNRRKVHPVLYKVEVPSDAIGLMSLSQGIAIDDDCIIRTNGVMNKVRGPKFIAPQCTLIQIV